VHSVYGPRTWNRLWSPNCHFLHSSTSSRPTCSSTRQCWLQLWVSCTIVRCCRDCTARMAPTTNVQTQLEWYMNLPGLEERLGPVGCLEPKHMLLLDVVCGSSCQSVVHTDGICRRAERRIALETPLVLVKIQHHVAQRRIELPPATTTDCSWTSTQNMPSFCDFIIGIFCSNDLKNAACVCVRINRETRDLIKSVKIPVILCNYQLIQWFQKITEIYINFVKLLK